jgi:hypothetical protein
LGEHVLFLDLPDLRAHNEILVPKGAPCGVRCRKPTKISVSNQKQKEEQREAESEQKKPKREQK